MRIGRESGGVVVFAFYLNIGGLSGPGISEEAGGPPCQGDTCQGKTENKK